MTDDQMAAELAALDASLDAALEDFQLDDALPEQVTAQVEPLHAAQSIQCGQYKLAFNFGWANVIVDEFDLVPIPKAPEWLVGAVNVDGSIVPVVDLRQYIDPEGAGHAIGREHRLLIGGRTDGSNENALGILFAGLPFQIGYTRGPLAADVVLPERLRELAKGLAVTASGDANIEINTNRLIDVLSLDLV